MNKKIFISHATEDNKRFVDDFVEKLRLNGYDTWYDKYEMKPGNSILKIFEGLHEADIIIFVLSKISVKKPWVIKEIEVAVERNLKLEKELIPVVIDRNVDIPTPLIGLIYLDFSYSNNYGMEFAKLFARLEELEKDSISDNFASEKLKNCKETYPNIYSLLHELWQLRVLRKYTKSAAEIIERSVLQKTIMSNFINGKRSRILQNPFTRRLTDLDIEDILFQAKANLRTELLYLRKHSYQNNPFSPETEIMEKLSSSKRMREVLDDTNIRNYLEGVKLFDINKEAQILSKIIISKSPRFRQFQSGIFPFEFEHKVGYCRFTKNEIKEVKWEFSRFLARLLTLKYFTYYFDERIWYVFLNLYDSSISNQKVNGFCSL